MQFIPPPGTPAHPFETQHNATPSWLLQSCTWPNSFLHYAFKAHSAIDLLGVKLAMHFKQNQKMLQLQAITTYSYIYRYYFLQSRSQVQKERVYTGGRPPLESTLVLWDDDLVRHSFLSFFALLYWCAHRQMTSGRRFEKLSSSLPLLPGHEYVRAWGGGGSSWNHSRAQELRMARTSLAHSICMRQWHQALLITVLHSHLYAAFFAQLGSCDL